MSKTRVPAALYSAVKRDLRPVRPLASPARRALALLPVAIVLLVGMPVFWAWRTHGVPAPWPSWSLSLLETALSLVVLAAAPERFTRERPGRDAEGRTILDISARVEGDTLVPAVSKSARLRRT